MIKQAFEVFTLTGQGYGKRHLQGYGWTRKEAKDIADRCEAKTQISIVHVTEVNGQWHRVHALPIEHIQGNPTDAADSRIILGDIPVRSIPAMFLQVNNDPEAKRLVASSLAKSLDMIIANDSHAKLRLSTLRIGGPLPIEFTLAELHNNVDLQAKVLTWLRTEIEWRATHATKELQN